MTHRVRSASALRASASRKRRSSGLTMPEAVLVISIGALVVVGATVAGISIMSRIQSDARSAELSTVVESVWDRYRNAAEYTGLKTETVAGGLPERMTNDDQTLIFLGGGVAPVSLHPGLAGSAVGATTTRTFTVTIGDEDFPIRSTLVCERMLGRWDDQESRLLGYQLRTAKAVVSTATGLANANSQAPATTNFTLRKGGSTTLLDLSLPANKASATATNVRLTAGPFWLNTVRTPHIRDACEKVTSLSSGAVIIFAFT